MAAGDLLLELDARRVEAQFAQAEAETRARRGGAGSIARRAQPKHRRRPAELARSDGGQPRMPAKRERTQAAEYAAAA